MWDREETKRRGYTDPKSKVFFDGRESLAGKDWTKRKKEVWERGHGRCEQRVQLDRLKPGDGLCRSEMHDPHHVVKRSRKRDDRLSNLIGLCRLHHELLDERKPRWSSKRRNEHFLGVG